jgi:alkylmercury lyase
LRADYPHRFFLDGRLFTTWCAWDTLFLPALLQSNAVVESPDPETGQIIHLQVSPERITSARPEAAVVSFVDGVSDECVDVATTQAAFCQLVHFFAGGLSAERFLAGRRAKGRVLTLDEGFALGQQLQKRLIDAARSMP